MNTLAIRLRSPLHVLLGARSVLRERPKPGRGKKLANLDGLSDYLLADVGLSRTSAQQVVRSYDVGSS